MATLQKIRNKGPLLVIVIGLALFAFIAGDLWKVFQPHQGRQDIGEINGKSVSAQDYQSMVDEYTKVQEKIYGRNASDDELTQAKDYIWNTYVQYTLIENEANKMGLKVTDAEIKDMIKKGTNPLLSQTPFVNPQTRMFDKNIMDAFVKNAPKEDVSLIMGYTEKQLKRALLINKYQNLVLKSVISNPVEAEYSFNARSNQSDLLLAALPYSAIADSTVQVSASEIKSLYSQKKEQFRNLAETRDIKYIDVFVTPSDADRQDLLNEVTEYSVELGKPETEVASFIGSTGTQVPYVDMPVSKSSLPTDIAGRLDSVALGEVYGPFYSATDDSYNAFKVLSKVSAPDSVQFRQIQVVAETAEATKSLTDSIMNAIKGGADFEAIAQKYGQVGTSNWISSRDYEGGQLDASYVKVFQSLNNLAPKELTSIEFPQGNVILQVVDRKNMINKYKVAVVKRPVEFSKETYAKAYNDFSQFVASNNTLEKMSQNAEEAGYRLLERANFSSSEHNVCGIHSTREALRWIFEAKKGDVSPLYDCGDNDHLLVVAVEGINKAGYLPVEKVSGDLKAELIRDKKAELLSEQLKKASNFEAVKSISNVEIDSVKHVSFASPAYVAVTHTSEPALSGNVAKAKANQLSAPVKGNGGVFVFQIYNQEKTNDKFNAKDEEATAANMNMRYASQFLGDLFLKANVKDSRYLYF
jgi:peptidyl-prolyl cis-trans isomerase D